jgi:hypothetical protein
LARLHLGQVDVEVADRVGSEALLAGLVALDLGQPADAVPLQAAVQARARQVRDGGLEAVEAVIERQERMPPEGVLSEFSCMGGRLTISQRWPS